MGKPPSLPARHTRVYMSGFGVCGGLRMMGASGGAAPRGAFSVAVSTVKLPVLVLCRASSAGAVPSVVRPVPEGAAKGGGWSHLQDARPMPRGCKITEERHFQTSCATKSQFKRCLSCTS